MIEYTNTLVLITFFWLLFISFEVENKENDKTILIKMAKPHHQTLNTKQKGQTKTRYINVINIYSFALIL